MPLHRPAPLLPAIIPSRYNSPYSSSPPERIVEPLSASPLPHGLLLPRVPLRVPARVHGAVLPVPGTQAQERLAAHRVAVLLRVGRARLRRPHDRIDRGQLDARTRTRPETPKSAREGVG